jgi:hypothetical protein
MPKTISATTDPLSVNIGPNSIIAGARAAIVCRHDDNTPGELPASVSLHYLL